MDLKETGGIVGAFYLYSCFFCVLQMFFFDFRGTSESELFDKPILLEVRQHAV